MPDSPKISPGVKRLLISELLIVLLLIGGRGIAVYLYGQRDEVQQKDIPITNLNVDVFELQEHDFQEIFTGFGTARADREVIVAAQVAGEIIDIHPELKVGQFVSAGQFIPPTDGPSSQRDADLLARIDARDLVQREAQAQTRIEEAEAEVERLGVQEKTTVRQLEQAKKIFATLTADLKRAERAASRGAASESELSRAQLEVQRYEDSMLQLENQLESLPIQVKAAEQRKQAAVADRVQAANDIKRTEVVPPFDGVVSEVFVEKGQYLRPGERIVQLTDPNKVEIPVSLGFEDFVQLEALLATSDTTELRPKVTLAENETSAPRWTGVLQRVSPVADPRSRTVEVFAEVENKSDVPPLLPGAFVYARIDGPIYRQRLLVPREAIRDGAVFVVREVDADVETKSDDNKANASDVEVESESEEPKTKTVTRAFRVPVKTRRTFQALVEVVVPQSSDSIDADHTDVRLQAGDRIVMTNLDIIEDGKDVVIQEKRSVASELAEIRVPLIRLIDED